MKLEATSQAFNARHVAVAKVNHQSKRLKYDVFELAKKDYPIISKLYKSIKLDKIEPNLDAYDSSLWQSILSLVLTQPNSDRVKTLLLVKGDKACGAMKYSSNKTTYHISGRTTWGRKNKLKLPFAGKALSFTLFNMLLKENKQKFESQIIRINRFFGVKKAKEIGFKSTGGDDFIENMRITKTQVQKTLDAYKDFVSIELLDNNNDIDLNDIIKI